MRALRPVRPGIPTLLALIALAHAAPRAVTQPAPAACSATTWGDRRQEIETFLKAAEVVAMEEIKVGVTRPRRAALAPGGPVEAIAWKVVPPGRPHGFWESYRSEIAAYELDRFLGLDMVPPTVEKRVKGDQGAAVMWCSGTKSFKELGGVPTPPPARGVVWMRQIVRAKMFDNLIGNKDPNLGNWLVDPEWNLILIDHTRAFTTDKEMPHKTIDHIDAALWERMQGLTVDTLDQVIGRWVGKREIRAVIERRDRMQQAFEKLRAAKGEAAVIR